MVEQRYSTQAGDYDFLWTRCCCGVRCYSNKTLRADMINPPKVMVELCEFKFQETIEQTAQRCQEAALQLAKERLP